MGSRSPASHLIDVRLEVASPDPNGQVIRLPDWIPGSYMIRDYARHIVSIEARMEGKPVKLERLGKSAWRAPSEAGKLEVSYQVYAWDLSVRGAHFDNTHLYFNGPCVFFEVTDQSDALYNIVIERPDCDCSSWQLATSLCAVSVDECGFGHYQAASYAELIDHPVEAGALERVSFEVAGVAHEFAIIGAQACNLERLKTDLIPLLTEHHALLGTPGDLDRYLFLAMASESGYGGLEHGWGSSLAVSRAALPAENTTEISEAYRTMLGLISHEYFHLWNIKRMKPAAFMPYDLTRETHTGLLWVFEGVTSYYDDLALVRSGLIDEATYLELLGQAVTKVIRVQGRHRQSLIDASYDAWTKLYKRNENSSNALISYYTKGSLVALALDLSLRLEGKDLSLDTIMLAAWSLYGETNTGMPEDGFEALVIDIAGAKYRQFFDRFVHGTEDPPLAELLGEFGVEYHARQSAGAGDVGGKAVEDTQKLWIGAECKDQPNGVLLSAVTNGGPAERAGLSAGDVVVAFAGKKASVKSLLTELTRHSPGGSISVDYFRADILHSGRMSLEAAPADTCYLTVDASAPASLRQAWLASRQ